MNDDELTAEAENCRLNCAEPALKPGSKRAEGTYFRNLDKEQVTKRYAKDGLPPQFGYRVHWKKWAWEADEDGVGLSVNCSSCIGSPRCSLVTDASPRRRSHVVAIHLEALRELSKLDVVAVYTPVIGHPKLPENRCHYEFMPIDASLDDLRYALALVFGEHDSSDPRWPKCNVPSNADDVARATELATRASKVFSVYRDVAVWSASEGTGSAGGGQ